MSDRRLSSTRVLVRLAACLTAGFLCVATGHAQECPDLSDSVGSHSFRRVGETIEIPIALGDCQPIALEVHWNNGRNNGSLFNLTFLDDNDHTLYTKQISAFLFGRFEFPLDPSPTLSASGVVSLMAVPSFVTVQAAPPFGLPATLSYRVMRLKRTPRPQRRSTAESSKSEVTPAGDGSGGGQRNVVQSIQRAVRMIGASRMELVQIHLKTNMPFPAREEALQLRVGERVFFEELSGDFTGRELVLTLTPKMFDELRDGAEIVAFYKGAEATWSFGKLEKRMLVKSAADLRGSPQM